MGMTPRGMRWAVGLTALVWVCGAWAAVPSFVWVEQCTPHLRHDYVLRLTWDEALPGDGPVALNVGVHGNDTIDDAYLDTAIRDQKGASVFSNRQNLLLDVDFHSYAIVWNAADLPCGRYTVSFSVKRPPALEVLRQEYVLRKGTGDELRAELEDVTGRVAHTDALMSSLGVSPYTSMRAALASDMLERARLALESGAFAQAARRLDYVKQAVAAVARDCEANAAVPVEWREVVTPPDSVRIANGGFEGDGRARLPFGLQLGNSPAPEMIARLVRLGLGLAAFGITPDCDADAPALAPFLDEAAKSRILLLPSLVPDAWSAAMRESMKAAIDESSGRVNLASSEAQAVLQRHIGTAMSVLASRSNVVAVCLAEAPFLKFTGDTVKQGFLASVKSQYADRAALNRSWKGLFADMNDLDIGWNYVNPRYQDSSAYRYDWQSYHLSLTAQWAASAMALAHTGAPGVPVTLATPDTAVESEDVALAVDRDALASTMDISACVACNTPGDTFYGIGYPQQDVTYTLLRSLAPAKPVVNMALRLFDGDTWETPCSFGRGHTEVWEAAMSGLNGAALIVPEDLMRPEGLEGYAAAALDLNRLAPIVTAFQNAPADVRILYSQASKIYSDGAPHLSSACYAFEGCSFAGYKVQYVTEREIAEQGLQDVKVLVVPDTPAVNDAAFPVLKEYMQGEGCVIRTSTSIMFDERGHSRRDIITAGRRTIHVRGQNLPAEYLHAMDGVTRFGVLPAVPHVVNEHNYPIEGVKTLYVELDGVGYLYLANLRKDAQVCYMLEGSGHGRDLIGGRDVCFPLHLEPLDPMLIRLEAAPKAAKHKTKHVRRSWERNAPDLQTRSTDLQ